MAPMITFPEDYAPYKDSDKGMFRLFMNKIVQVRKTEESKDPNANSVMND